MVGSHCFLSALARGAARLRPLAVLKLATANSDSTAERPAKYSTAIQEARLFNFGCGLRCQRTTAPVPGGHCGRTRFYLSSAAVPSFAIQ